MRVLVAEDDAVTAELLVSQLVAFGYDATLARNGVEAFDCLRSGRHRMLVTDWRMPEMDGIELCRKIRQRPTAEYVYIILVTANEGTANVVAGLDAGADDYIVKPFHPEELRVRLRTGERILSLESRDMTIFALAKLAESRDLETGTHLERMREYCRLIAEELTAHSRFREQVDGDFVQLMYLTSPLHDIGKVGIPDRILQKPGRFTRVERLLMHQHTIIGGATLEAATCAYPEARFLGMARDIALTHHESFDGAGYPHGLAGDAIPLCGRIASVADVYDALTTRRVYKPAYSHEHAKDIMLAGRGRQFDPDILDAFFVRENEVLALSRRLGDLPPARSSQGEPGTLPIVVCRGGRPRAGVTRHAPANCVGFQGR